MTGEGLFGERIQQRIVLGNLLSGRDVLETAIERCTPAVKVAQAQE